MDASGPTVVFADEQVLVVLKPAGLPAVPGRAEGLHDCLWSRLRQRHAEALVVHRLDMATSGLMLFARSREAQSRLSRAFAERAVEKHYDAWVEGLDAPEPRHEGRIDLPIGAEWSQRPRRRIDAVAGKASLTLWRRVSEDRAAGRTRLALQPLTGRTHQLRVHLAASGHPIVGDALYGTAPMPGGRLMLHACSIAFDHPFEGRRCHFESPADF